MLYEVEFFRSETEDTFYRVIDAPEWVVTETGCGFAQSFVDYCHLVARTSDAQWFAISEFHPVTISEDAVESGAATYRLAEFYV